MTKTIRTALVGCGKVGQTHAQALQALPQSEFVAAFDVDAGRANAFAALYGVQGYADLDRMIDEAGVQMISHLHAPPHPRRCHQPRGAQGRELLGRKAARLRPGGRRPRHRRLPRRRRQAGRGQPAPPLSARGSAWRTPSAAGKIGQPVLGTLTVMGWRDEAYYRSDAWRGRWETEGGGVLVNQTPHQLDMLQWLMGSEIDELFGYWDNLNHPYIEVEDTAIAVLRFKSGGAGPNSW